MMKVKVPWELIKNFPYEILADFKDKEEDYVSIKVVKFLCVPSWVQCSTQQYANNESVFN
jgi:hypothetical protein